MLTPEMLDRVPDRAVELFQGLEDRILQDMARRISQGAEKMATLDWEMWKLQQLGEEAEYIRRELSRMTGKTEEEIEAVFLDAAQNSLAFDDSIYKQAGLSPGPVLKSPVMKNLLYAGLKKTRRTFQNLTGTIANTATGQFERVLDEAWMDAMSGAFTYQAAVERGVSKLASSGIEAIRYPSGKTDVIDVAVRRAVLSGVNKGTSELSLARAEEMGCDLVETTAHMGARPSHAVWQGRVFSRSGKSAKYPDFVRSTGYGTGPGLCGWNCRHSFFPFIEGFSVRAYTQRELAKLSAKDIPYQGGKITAYEASQKQRYIERGIRKWKREYLAKEAAGLDASQAGARLSKWNSALNSFLEETGRKKDYARTKVYGFGRSQAAKAAAAGRKANSYQDLVGVEVSKNLKVTGLSKHFGERSIEREVSANDIRDALTNPILTGKIRNNNSQQFIGEKATIVINTKTGNLITVWRTSKKKGKKRDHDE